MGLDNREKYKKYRPKKFLGQNFLVDENIARKIVDSLKINSEDIIIEIGPGYGSLTKYFIESASNYLAVEIDKNIKEKLQTDLFSKYPAKNISIIHKDFLDFDFEKDLMKFFPDAGERTVKIAGNIPYNISTGILFKLFDNKKFISAAVMMIQREVAQRLTARPDTKEYGILAVMTGFNSDVKTLFNVPPTAFFPKPKIYSSVIEVTLKKDDGRLKDYGIFRILVRESFGKRRKTMKNSLKSFFERQNIKSGSVDFDFSRRPENLSINEFILLSNRISFLSGREAKSKD